MSPWSAWVVYLRLDGTHIAPPPGPGFEVMTCKNCLLGFICYSPGYTGERHYHCYWCKQLMTMEQPWLERMVVTWALAPPNSLPGRRDN